MRRLTLCMLIGVLLLIFVPVAGAAMADAPDLANETIYEAIPIGPVMVYRVIEADEQHHRQLVTGAVMVEVLMFSHQNIDNNLVADATKKAEALFEDAGPMTEVDGRMASSSPMVTDSDVTDIIADVVATLQRLQNRSNFPQLAPAVFHVRDRDTDIETLLANHACDAPVGTIKGARHMALSRPHFSGTLFG